jgi:hypothetical protein
VKGANPIYKASCPWHGALGRFGVRDSAKVSEA